MNDTQNSDTGPAAPWSVIRELESNLAHYVREADDNRRAFEAAQGRVEQLERSLAAEKERANYAWQNTREIDAARMKQDKEIAALRRDKERLEKENAKLALGALRSQLEEAP